MKKKLAAIVLSCAITVSSTTGMPAFYGETIVAAAEIAQENPVAETTNGSVMGSVIEGVEVYRGIPYGGNCDGENRFLPPTPAESWTDVRDCTKNGPYAYQAAPGSISDPNDEQGLGAYFSGGSDSFGTEDEVPSENCLVLNVVTPKSDDTKRPVIVYIHGGGFNQGTGSLVLGSQKLVKDENVVMVGVNHRLNAFGYMYLGAYDDKYAESGMAGILDLIQALQWVQDNIEKFGGDPSNVTVLGESGGAMKICTLMAMKKSEGLFQRAIIESGAQPAGTYSPEAATAVTDKIFDILGIDPKNNLDEITKIPAEEIYAAAVEAGLSFNPVADGINLAYNEEKNYQAYEWSKNVDVMVGSSEDEMGVFIPIETVQEITWDNLAEKLVAGSDVITEENVEEVIQVYKELDTKGDDAGHLYLKIISTSGFLGGGAFPEAMAKAEQGGSSVYHYLVSYDSVLPTAPEYRMAWHTADLPLQFRIVAYPESEELSQIMSSAIAAFARTGNPSTESLEWPKFTPETRQVMVFDDECRVETDPMKTTREVFE